METVISIVLGILGAYFAAGILFALYFLLIGAKKIDPQLGGSKKSVRILLFPGVMATWPFFFVKLFRPKAQ